MCQRYSARGLGGQDWGQGEGNRWENLFVFKTCIKKRLMCYECTAILPFENLLCQGPSQPAIVYLQ